MRLEVLLSGLENPQPAVRLDVVRVLGMLDETRALSALRERYTQEPDPTVKQGIAWAGKRLYQAEQAGYSTVDEVCRHFGVDRELEEMSDATEAELINKMQHDFERDLRDGQTRMSRRKAGLAAAAAIGGTMFGGTSMGMMAMAGAMQPGAESSSSGLTVGGQGARRTPATAPANVDIDVWLRRLRDAPTPELREQATIELAQLNNPKALPFLAAAFLNDSSPKVRQAAQRFGKVLYWSAVYWEMERSGALAEEMQRRAAAMGKTIKVETGGLQTPTPQAETPAEPANSAPRESGTITGRCGRDFAQSPGGPCCPPPQRSLGREVVKI